MNKILFIDDDTELLEILSASFKEKGFKVKSCSSAKDGIAFLKKKQVDCIVMDVMMPEMDGFTAFEHVRKVSDAPIIYLTGKVSEDDRIDGITLGADDYMLKPFSVRELEARVKMVVRRSGGNKDSHILSIPPLELDTVAHKVMCDGEEIVLTAREYELLHMMITFKGDVITYEDIGNFFWGGYNESDKASVMVNVSRLRKKLEENPLSADIIETVWTKGYRFTPRGR